MTNVDIKALKNASMRLRLDEAKKKTQPKILALTKQKEKDASQKLLGTRETML